MTISWTISVTCKSKEFPASTIEIAKFSRPSCNAMPADFGLSLAEARTMLSNLQQNVAQTQIHTYDAQHRNCPHCGRYRQIKDWRARTIQTTLGKIAIRVPRVHSCMCLPEPMNADGDIIPYRESECCVERMLPKRMTPELLYLCAKHGAAAPFRSAAATVRDMTGLSG